MKKNERRSDTREAVFEFVVDYKRRHDGNPPSTPEIAEACAISDATAYYHLTKLEAEDRIHMGGERRCLIEVVGGQWTFESTQPTEERQETEHAEESSDGLLQTQKRRTRSTH
jgi:hypothetical protein